MTDRLVDDWRDCLRWWSVRWMAFTGLVLEFVQLAPVIPPEIMQVIPQPWGHIVPAVWTALGIFARLYKQKIKDGGQ